MLAWLKNKYKQLICKHLLTSGEPIMNPETWDMELTCGKCGKVFNCNEDFINGKY
jgi:hypothetical protein